MSTQIQRRRGTTAQHSSFTGAVGETTIDTDKEVVVVHDGVQVGGYPQMRENGSNSALALGSAGTPSLKFTGDTNTGIYSPGADQVAISTNGQGKLFINSTGQLGVNIASPDGTAHVHTASAGTITPSTAADDLVVENSGAGGISILTPDATNGAIFFGSPSDAAGGTIRWNYSLGEFGIGPDKSGGYLRFNSDDGFERLRITSTGALNFVGAGTAGSTQAVSFNGSAPVNSLVIDSTGKVGLGTSSPSEALHVVGKIAVSGTNPSVRQTVQTANLDLCGGTAVGIDSSIQIYGSTNATDANVIYYNGTTHKWRSASGSTQYAVIDASGRLGIGTTSPSATLQVSPSSGSANFQVSRGSKGLQINQDSDSANPNFNTIGTSSLVILRDGSETARFDTSGRLLVGTSTARANFFNTTLTAGIQVEGTGGTTARGALSVVNNDSSNNPALLILGRSRTASLSSNTVVANDDLIGTLSFQGADGTDFVEAARIRAEVDGTPGADDMPGRLVFSTTADGASSPTEAMRITEAREIWVNRTSRDPNVSSACKFQIAGGNAEWSAAIRNAGASPYGMIISYQTDSNGVGNEFLTCVGNTTSRFTARSNGGLANYSANNVNLSDRNVKKDITLATGTWDCLKEWEIVNFRYKDQPDDADLNMGVIAQQIAEHCPEVITVFEEAKDDQPEKLGVKDQQMMWMAIKALQEAQLRIETLEAEVAALKGA